MDATAQLAAVALAYLALYTAYSKAKRTLRLGVLADVFLVRRGARHAIDELNKVAALAGLTALALAAARRSSELAWASALVLGAHAVCSLALHYDTPHIPALSGWLQAVRVGLRGGGKQRVALARVAAAVAGASSLVLVLVYGVGSAAVVGGSVVLGAVHFVLMEVDFRGRLAVRPAGYLALVAAAWAVWRVVA